MGRAQSMHVRITDISVSRHHGDISLNYDGTVSLIDNYSKFGTLKLLNKPLAVPIKQKGSDEGAYF